MSQAWSLGACAVLATLCTGCLDTLEPGHLGTLRYFGEVRGVAPLALTPPTSDRDGNVYVLYGLPENPEAQVFSGKNVGGWASSCTATKGDKFGVHGWIGHTQKKAWYWSGTALVKVNGETTGCDQVLATDPTSRVELFFRAIVPWIRDSPSQTTVVALVEAVSDPLPHLVVIDLTNSVYLQNEEFSPTDATQVQVLGVGASRPSGAGFFLLKYLLAGKQIVEGRFISSLGKTEASVPITIPAGSGELTEYMIAGYLQTNAQGLVAGVDQQGRLFLFNRAGGHLESVTTMTPVGVHEWNGQLYLVGTRDGLPVVARIGDNGELGQPELWTSSQAAADALTQPLAIEDDRVKPRRRVEWSDTKNGIGAFPFLHPHTPDRYAPGTTGWVVAGPTEVFGGGTQRTSVAFAPVGISYP